MNKSNDIHKEETKPVRTKDQITQEYRQCAVDAGDYGYRIQALHGRMYQLNQEINAIPQEEKEQLQVVTPEVVA